MTITEHTQCRVCGSTDLSVVLDLGNLAISDFPPPDTDLDNLDKAPLTLTRCLSCTLVQLTHSVDRDRLYRSYNYKSSINETMVAALHDVVDDARRRVELKPGDAVLDIGCNDGTLLRAYPSWVTRIGFDPSDVASAAWIAGGGYDLRRSFFPPTQQHVPMPCKIVTAIAMFYDLDDPNAFLSEVRRWLHPEGVLVLQFQDLASMVDANAVDNICHEHVCYYDRGSLTGLLNRHGFGTITSSYVPINGGSLRVVAQLGGEGATDDTDDWADDWTRFAVRVARQRAEMLDLLHRLKDERRRVYGIAASTKFNTLSQYYGIGPELVQAIGERSADKWGKHTVTGIPIISEDEMRAARPDYLLCCAWGFWEAFAAREHTLLGSGAKLIVPLPTLRVISAADVTRAA